MIGLRIIAGIFGLWFMWVYTFALCEKPRPIWDNICGAAALFVVLVLAFLLLQFATAGRP